LKSAPDARPVPIVASLYDLKPGFKDLLRPLVTRLAALGLTANGVTLATVLGSILCGLALVVRPRGYPLLLLPAWLFVRMALNAIDGMLAREHHQKSALGGILNEVGDVVSDTALYLPLAVFPNALWPAVAFVLAAFGTEFCGVLSQALGADRQYQGPMGKSDRAFLVGALGLVSALYPRALVAWPWVLGGGTLLGVWTCARRCAIALGRPAHQP
jgi:phosphatidylglycerophosphate synthase